MSKPRPIQKLDTAPKFLAGMAGVINSLVKRVNVLSSMEGDGKVVVAITENNAKVMLGEKNQGGIPDGYEEFEVTLCQNGTPVTGTILFKEEPEE